MPRTILYKGGPWAEKTEPDNGAARANIANINSSAEGSYVENPSYGTFTFDGLPARVFVWQAR